MIARLLLGPLFLLPAMVWPASLESVSDGVVRKYMQEKQIPGMSVAIVLSEKVVFSKGYGLASIEFDIPASPDTVYPISSVTRIFTGLLAMRLAATGCLDIDASVGSYLPIVPSDKRPITIRHLLMHTHGLEDFYNSEPYRHASGKTLDESTTDELIRWSLSRPLLSQPGDNWQYGVAGYVLLAAAMQAGCGDSYAQMVNEQVFEPLSMTAQFGGSGTVVRNRNPILYELVEEGVAGHVVDFAEMAWAAGGLNLSVREMSRVFVAISRGDFLGDLALAELWKQGTLANGRSTHYGLGWFSYTSSQNRRVVGHEGGGASWVIYYPDTEVAIIALSNLSGARADSLPFEIARAAFDAGLLPELRPQDK